MAGQVILKLFLLAGVMSVRGQSTEAEPCWNRTVHTDDVLVVCRLEVDVSKTRHAIAVAHSDRESKRILVCGWNGERCPKCYSDYGVQPLGDLTDVLIAMVPADEWQNEDSYKYQLVPPPDRKDPYIACEVIKTKTDPQVDIPVTQETTDEATTSAIPNVTQQATVEAIAPTARTCVGGDDQDTGNISDIHSLVVIATVLLVIILVSIFIISIFAYFKFKKLTWYTMNNADGKSSSTVDNGSRSGSLKSEKSDCDVVISLLSEEARETILDRGQTADGNLYRPLMSTDEQRISRPEEFPLGRNDHCQPGSADLMSPPKTTRPSSTAISRSDGNSACAWSQAQDQKGGGL